MPEFSSVSRWPLALLLLCTLLSARDMTPLMAGQSDDIKKDQPAAAADRPHDGLAAIALPDQDEDHDRLFRSLHGAHMLAEAGAGYEAARVLAALAMRVGDTEPGQQAQHLLESWGLTVEDVRRGTPAAINGTIAKRMRGRGQDGAHTGHVRNLIELALYPAAARVLRGSVDDADPRQIERQWGEVLERYRVEPDLLLADEDEQRLIDVIQTGHARNQLLRQARVLRVFDEEAGELGRMLFDRLGHQRGPRERHSDNEFARWVERDRDEGDQRGPSTVELTRHVMRHAQELYEHSPEAARILARLVIAAGPKSPAAASARELADRKLPSAPNTLRQRFTATKDAGAEIFEARPQRVRSYQIELSDDAIELLREEPKDYVRGTFREGDDVYPDVGVRLKGSWGSFRMLDGRSKAAFTIKFNEFNKGQRFHGLRRIVLNNGIQDPTYMHEYIGYGLFRDAGVPAPRVAYANLSVNGERYGLYVQIEAITKDFLKRWFTDDGGNLYEGPPDVLEWRALDLDTNQARNNRNDLRLLVKTVERADDNDPWDSLQERVAAEKFALFLAMEQFVGHWDGYTQTNNYRMYNDPKTRQFVFFPHGADQLFEELGGSVFRSQGGILGRALLQTERGRERYVQALQRIVDQVWDEDAIRSRVAQVYPLIRPHVLSKQAKGRRNAHEFEDRVSRMLRFISFRRYAVAGQLRAADSGDSWRERRHHDGLPSFLHRSRDE